MRVVGTVLLVLVTAALGCVRLVGEVYVGTGLRDTARVHRAEARARGELSAGLPRARADVAAWRAQLATGSGEGRAPAYAWSELTCTLENVDVGWIVQYYEQRCSVRAVAAWTRSAPTPRCVSGGRASEDFTWPCPGFLTGPPALGTTRLLEGSRVPDLAASAGWAVEEHTVEVSRTTLGCDPWAVLFCTPPADGPVMGPP